MALTTKFQLRIVRSFLRLDQRAFAQLTGVSVGIIKLMERAADGPLQCNPVTRRKIEAALNAVGIEFADNGTSFWKRPDPAEAVCAGSVDDEYESYDDADPRDEASRLKADWK